MFDELEKRRQEGKSQLLGTLLGPIGHCGHEGQNVLRCDGDQLYVTEIDLEMTEDELVIT